MKNVHVIPTDKPSRLHLGNSGLVLCDLYYSSNTINSQNIYITSDEEIKEGDWVYSIRDNWINKCVNPMSVFEIALSCKKIILTTDQDLIKDGVQAIDDTFLEWFVKNPSCQEVEVEEFNVKVDLLEYKTSYKIIIPKEHPKQIKCYCGHTTYCDCSPLEEPKQETIEDAAELFADDEPNCDYEAGIKTGKYQGFKFGAKWMQDRMYSEEDMAESFMACWKANVPEGFECKLSFKEWFEQFKKK